MNATEFIYMRPELYKRTRRHFEDILQDPDCKLFVNIIGDYNEFIGPSLSRRLNPRRRSQSRSFSAPSPRKTPITTQTMPPPSIDSPPTTPSSPSSILSWMSRIGQNQIPVSPTPTISTSAAPLAPPFVVQQAWTRYGEGHDIEILWEKAVKRPIQFLEDVRLLLAFMQQDSAGKKLETWVEIANKSASHLREALKSSLKRRDANMLDVKRRRPSLVSNFSVSRSVDIKEEAEGENCGRFHDED